MGLFCVGSGEEGYAPIGWCNTCRGICHKHQCKRMFCGFSMCLGWNSTAFSFRSFVVSDFVVIICGAEGLLLGCLGKCWNDMWPCLLFSWADQAISLVVKGSSSAVQKSKQLCQIFWAPCRSSCSSKHHYLAQMAWIWWMPNIFQKLHRTTLCCSC